MFYTRVRVLNPVRSPQSAVRSPQSLFYSDRLVVHERSTGDFSFGVLDNGNIPYFPTQPPYATFPLKPDAKATEMWRRKLFGGREFESSLSKLISETGISRQEAEKILRQCNGDLKLAKQQAQAGVLGQTSRSIAGKNGELPSSSAGSYSDAPPPYSETVEGAMSLPVSLPPPYVSQEKQSLMGELKAVFSSDNVEERCCACFDRIQPDKDEGFSGEVIWQGLKVLNLQPRSILSHINNT